MRALVELFPEGAQSAPQGAGRQLPLHFAALGPCDLPACDALLGAFPDGVKERSHDDESRKTAWVFVRVDVSR